MQPRPALLPLLPRSILLSSSRTVISPECSPKQGTDWGLGGRCHSLDPQQHPKLSTPSWRPLRGRQSLGAQIQSKAKDTVGVHTPHGSSMAHVSAQPLTVHRVPHVDNLEELMTVTQGKHPMQSNSLLFRGSPGTLHSR